MKVLVYVEGPGDRDALAELFRAAAQEASAQRIGLKFLTRPIMNETSPNIIWAPSNCPGTFPHN